MFIQLDQISTQNNLDISLKLKHSPLKYTEFSIHNFQVTLFYRDAQQSLWSVVNHSTIELLRSSSLWYVFIFTENQCQMLSRCNLLFKLFRSRVKHSNWLTSKQAMFIFLGLSFLLWNQYFFLPLVQNRTLVWLVWQKRSIVNVLLSLLLRWVAVESSVATVTLSEVSEEIVTRRCLLWDLPSGQAALSLQWRWTNAEFAAPFSSKKTQGRKEPAEIQFTKLRKLSEKKQHCCCCQKWNSVKISFWGSCGELIFYNRCLLCNEVSSLSSLTSLPLWEKIFSELE